MKTRTILSLAAALIAFAPFASAQRPSTDELALRTGVTAWVGTWDLLEKDRNLTQLASLYRPNLITLGAEGPLKSWSEYAASARGYAQQLSTFAAGAIQDLRVNFTDGRGITTFRLNPRTILADGREERRTTEVRFVWEKAAGVWQIAEQHIVCAPQPNVPNVTIVTSR
jgi:hypothetical protein